MVALNIHTLHNNQKTTSYVVNQKEEITLAQVEYKGTGRRKNSVARVRLVPGEGNITVNERDVRDYLPFESLILDLNQPFDVTETKGNYDAVSYTHL